MNKLIKNSIFTVIAIAIACVGLWYIITAGNGTNPIYNKIVAMDSDGFFNWILYYCVMFGSLMLGACCLNGLLILPEVYGVKAKSWLHIVLCVIRALLIVGGGVLFGLYQNVDSVFAKIFAVLFGLVLAIWVFLPTELFLIKFYHSEDFYSSIGRFVGGSIIAVISAALFVPSFIAIFILIIVFIIDSLISQSLYYKFLDLLYD